MPNYVKESRQKQIHQAQARALSHYKSRVRRRLILAAICFIAIGMLIGVFVAPAVKAQTAFHKSAGSVQQPQYISVPVESGDTLTGIAGKYYEGSGLSRKAFVREIMEMNHMDNTMIRRGTHIMVPCYEESKI